MRFITDITRDQRSDARSGLCLPCLHTPPTRRPGSATRPAFFRLPPPEDDTTAGAAAGARPRLAPIDSAQAKEATAAPMPCPRARVHAHGCAGRFVDLWHRGIARSCDRPSPTVQLSLWPAQVQTASSARFATCSLLLRPASCPWRAFLSFDVPHASMLRDIVAEYVATFPRLKLQMQLVEHPRRAAWGRMGPSTLSGSVRG